MSALLIKVKEFSAVNCENKSKLVLKFIRLFLLHPDIVNYSREEQKELLNFLENNDNKVVEKFLIDYSNLRKNIRVCKKHE